MYVSVYLKCSCHNFTLWGYLPTYISYVCTYIHASPTLYMHCHCTEQTGWWSSASRDACGSTVVIGNVSFSGTRSTDSPSSSSQLNNLWGKNFIISKQKSTHWYVLLFTLKFNNIVVNVLLDNLVIGNLGYNLYCYLHVLTLLNRYCR